VAALGLATDAPLEIDIVVSGMSGLKGVECVKVNARTQSASLGALNSDLIEAIYNACQGTKPQTEPKYSYEIDSESASLSKFKEFSCMDVHTDSSLFRRQRNEGIQDSYEPQAKLQVNIHTPETTGSRSDILSNTPDCRGKPWRYPSELCSSFFRRTETILQERKEHTDKCWACYRQRVQYACNPNGGRRPHFLKNLSEIVPALVKDF
jgi:hypothetical protein